LEIPTLGRKIFRRNHLRFPPISGIIANILADAVQFVGVADDVFVIIALPNILDVGILMHPFGYPDLIVYFIFCRYKLILPLIFVNKIH
jgi:hypothetical protein